MSLHEAGVLGLGQDLEQIFIGEEEETSEDKSLLLEVVREALLDLVQLLVGLLEVLHDVLLVSEVHDAGLFVDAVHGVLPMGVDLIEHLAFERHCVHDVSAREDGLQVHPRPLGLEHLFHELTHVVQLLLPHPGFVLQTALHERGAEHSLGSHDLVIELGVDIVIALDQEGDALVLSLLQREDLHVVLHRLQLLGQGVLLLGLHSDLFDGFDAPVDVVVDEVNDLHVVAVEVRDGYDLLDFLPVFVIDGLGREALDQGQILGELVDLGSQLLGYLGGFGVVFVQLLVELEALLVPLGDQ
mmetsp:Transcript_20668/g.31556  ORF Transcript_20668/g.31556 Transcript_20668/m.31556 type:complete len:299 (+) Transcript_20668:4097-4993(+)